MTPKTLQNSLIPLDFRGTPLGELAGIIAELEALTSSWNPVMLYTATLESREREKTRFVAGLESGRVIEPSFDYDAVQSFDSHGSRVLLQTLHERMSAFRATTSLEELTRTAIILKIEDDLATCDIAEGIQTKNDTLTKRGLTRKYPSTDPLLVREARRLYTAECTPVAATLGSLTDAERAMLLSRTFDATGVKHAYEWALSQYDLLAPANPRGFRVIIDPQVTAIDVRDKCEGGPTIVIPADEQQDARELLGLIAHEIEAHARQAANGLTLFPMGSAFRTDDETLYEGLAMRQEKAFITRYFGRSDDPESPLYVLAVALAEQGKSFSEIFLDQETLWARLDPTTARDRAWRTTYRVMRGHTDMRNTEGFAMAKDLAYLRGQIMDQKLQRLGMGILNESAIVSTTGLPLLSRFDIHEEDLPYPYKDVASAYLHMILRGEA